ncbi:transposase [Streptomyces sp. NPDC058293]|uniref:transposase n=1 Tax=Streptomyces sp. NPDC058293 TaxID=3346429 RepID=UPI0036E29CB4
MQLPFQVAELDDDQVVRARVDAEPALGRAGEVGEGVERRAVCPTGKTSATWNDVVREGVAKTVVAFAALDCIPCPVKEQCASSRKGRRLSLYARELTGAIRTARAHQQDGT